MSTENDDHDGGEWDERSDLTRLEDLSEFLHEEDPDVEAKLKAHEDSGSDLPDLPSEGEDLVGLGDLEDANDLEKEEEDSFSPTEDNTDDNLQNAEEFEDNSPSFSEDKTDPDFSVDDTFQASSDDTQADEGDEENQFGGETSFDSEDSFGGDDGDASEETPDWQEDDNSDQSFDSSSDSDFSSDQEDFQSYDDDNTSDNDGSEDFSLDENYSDESNDGENYSDEGDNNEAFSASDEDDSTETDNFSSDFSEDSDYKDQSDDGDSTQEDDAENFSLPDPEELENRPLIEAVAESPISSTQPRENFQDLRDFGNAITYGVVTTGGNPPFSLILRQVKYEEDAEDIKIVLREHGLLTDENEETITQGLEQGSLLISQISEYSAIYLAHKLRRFDVELRLGLSDQLHPSKSYSREGKGLVSKYNLRQNHREALVTAEAEVDVHDIKMSTTPTLDGYNIHRYIDVITTHTLIEEEELKRLHNLNLSIDEAEETEVLLEEILEQFPKEELDSPMEQFDLGLNEIYRELVVELRNEAFKVEANAVVGINFNITPMMFRSGNSTSVHYKITCSGNAVWVVDHQS